MNDETTLLPCPWCGVDMKLHAINYPWADGEPGWNIWHEDMGEAGKRKCPMEMGCYDTREEAIAAWNTRAAKPCYATDYTHEHCKYSVNRGWVENVAHGTLTAEQVEDIVYRNTEFYEGGDVDVQAITDELNAELGSGTCEIETTESWLPAERYHRCKNCGAFFAVMNASGDIPPCVCPNCGKAVTRCSAH